MKTSDMSQEELNIYSDINNPNNDSNMNQWADTHNPNNDNFIDGEYHDENTTQPGNTTESNKYFNTTVNSMFSIKNNEAEINYKNKPDNELTEEELSAKYLCNFKIKIQSKQEMIDEAYKKQGWI